jgi:hypothetical protein
MALMLPSKAVCAQEPNILGTYSGTETSNIFNCGTGAPLVIHPCLQIMQKQEIYNEKYKR